MNQGPVLDSSPGPSAPVLPGRPLPDEGVTTYYEDDLGPAPRPPFIQIFLSWLGHTICSGNVGCEAGDFVHTLIHLFFLGSMVMCFMMGKLFRFTMANILLVFFPIEATVCFVSEWYTKSQAVLKIVVFIILCCFWWYWSMYPWAYYQATISLIPYLWELVDCVNPPGADVWAYMDGYYWDYSWLGLGIGFGIIFFGIEVLMCDAMAWACAFLFTLMGVPFFVIKYFSSSIADQYRKHYIVHFIGCVSALVAFTGCIWVLVSDRYGDMHFWSFPLVICSALTFMHTAFCLYVMFNSDLSIDESLGSLWVGWAAMIQNFCLIVFFILLYAPYFVKSVVALAYRWFDARFYYGSYSPCFDFRIVTAGTTTLYVFIGLLIICGLAVLGFSVLSCFRKISDSYASYADGYTAAHSNSAKKKKSHHRNR